MVQVVTYSLLLLLFILKPGEGATDAFVPPTLPNGRLCFCPGDMETYTCNVAGGTLNGWTGTSFDCPASRDRITFLIIDYSSGARGSCNNDAINASTISVDTSASPSCYTSQLSVTIDSNMDGQTVQCFRDTLQNMIGNHTLRVAGPPAPTNVMVTEVDFPTFTVTWTEPTSSCGASFSYEISSNCMDSSCSVTSSTTSGVCSGWATGQVCLAMVRTNSNLCDGQIVAVTDAVSLNLAVPSPVPASDIDVDPAYQLSDGGLISLTVSFPPVNPVMVTPLMALPNAYTVTVDDQPAILHESSCSATLCQYQTNFTSDNRPSNPFTVTVTVSNGVGNGQAVSAPFQIPTSISSLVMLTVVVMGSNANVSARLLDPSSFQGFTVSYKRCGDNATAMSSNSTAGDPLSVILTSIQPETDYCYSIFFNQGVLVFEVVGMFRSECNVADLSTETEVQTSEACPSDGTAGGITILNGRVCYTGTVPGAQHTAEPVCDKDSMLLSPNSSLFRVCLSDGTWNGTVAQCVNKMESPSWIIVVIVVSAIVLSFAIGIIVGILLTLFCGICVQGIQQRKCGTLLLVILLIIVFGLGIGILIGYCCVKNKKEKDDKSHLECQEINPPPADSLYADPKSIEHEAAPGTEDQYAMVDRKVKKNTKPKPTPPEALYQDPNTIEHETAASGDTYAVVDKPKRSSKKKGGPDVVPPASEGGVSGGGLV